MIFVALFLCARKMYNNVMKKIFITIIVLIVCAVAYWLISPFWKNTVVNESLPINSFDNSIGDNIVSNQVLAVGKFSGFDKLHNGSGTATLIKIDNKMFVRFEEDFVVTNGPDLFVGFGKNGEYIKGSEVSKLKGNIGSQNYELPEGFDINNSDEVWIWCKLFAVPFAKATLSTSI
jgi:hypothetical protein